VWAWVIDLKHPESEALLRKSGVDTNEKLK
jgi:hypothetical protein